MDINSKIYWHDAHHEALRMDTLVIKKTKDIQIDKNIGRIFKTHNIVEFKSPKDNFDFWDYQRVMGYAFTYSSSEKVQMSDITITISLTMYPRECIKKLKNERGIIVEDIGSGIYYIHGDIIPIQILESKKLSENENLFLRNLRSNLSGDDMYKTMQLYGKRKPLNDKNVFLDRLANANPNALKEALNMFTENNRAVIMEAIEEGGWLINRELENSKKVAKNISNTIAKKMLARGDSPDDIVEVTDLSVDEVIEIATQMQKTPVEA